jgi:hypothetical protein
MSLDNPEWDFGPPLQAPVRTFRDFEVSWAGHCPLNGGFCFGSEDGRILITDEAGGGAMGLKEPPAPSGEAINGLAFTRDLIAVSTRAEVVFVSQRPSQGKGYRSVLPGGAHGIVVTPSGRCVAPLGRSGLLRVTPVEGVQQPVTISRAADEVFNFYKAVYVPTPNLEVIACATRFGGVIGVDLSQGQTSRTFTSLRHVGLDIVDVCALGEGFSTPAVAAVGNDGTLLLSRNVLSDQQPLRLHFDEIDGTVYRVLCTNGHLAILTSTGLYLLVRLAQRFLDGEDIRYQRTSVRGVRVEAVDANVAGDRWILVVVSNGVMMVEVAHFVGSDISHGPTPAHEQRISGRESLPTLVESMGEWRESSSDEREELFAAVG